MQFGTDYADPATTMVVDVAVGLARSAFAEAWCAHRESANEVTVRRSQDGKSVEVIANKDFGTNKLKLIAFTTFFESKVMAEGTQADPRALPSTAFTMFDKSVFVHPKAPSMVWPSERERTGTHIDKKVTFVVPFWVVEETNNPEKVNAEISSLDVQCKVGKGTVAATFTVPFIHNTRPVRKGESIKTLKADLLKFLGNVEPLIKRQRIEGDGLAGAKGAKGATGAKGVKGAKGGKGRSKGGK